MKKTKWAEQRDEFFKRRFNEFFSEWKEKDKKNTQGEFARQICEIRNKKTGEKCPVTNSYVSEWSRGKWFPDQYIPEIAEVLGVKEEEFYFQTHDEFYKLSSEYMTRLGRGEMSQFCDEIGLDLRFLYAVRTLMGSDFDRKFPTFTPLHINPSWIFTDRYYTRRDKEIWSESAEMDDDVRVLQYEIEVNEEGNQKKRLIPFTRQDLRFLKRLQDDTIDYIEYLMMKCQKDRKREEDEANRRSIVKCADGGITHKPLPAEVLNQIDRDCNEYSDEKEGK